MSAVYYGNSGLNAERESLRILIKFRHGVGDNVHLSIPLKHIKSQRPKWEVDVAVSPRRENLFCHSNLCRKVFTYTRLPLDKHYDWVYENETIVFTKQWDQPYDTLQLPLKKYPGFPVSWATHFTKEVLQLELENELFSFFVGTDDRYHTIAERTVPFEKYAVINYYGKTNDSVSYFGEQEARKTCQILMEKGLTPIILDFDNRSLLPDNQKIFRANIPQESGVLAAFLKRAAVYIGLDSGPLALAAAVGTPTIALWDITSPQYLFAFNENALHFHPKGFTDICERFKTIPKFWHFLENL